MKFPRTDYQDRANRRALVYSQGVKVLFILHGGAVLSLLTFVTQIIINAPQLLPVANYAVWAIALWGTGLVALIPINHLRYETSRYYDHPSTKVKGKRLGMVHRALFYLSFVLFIAGLISILIGLFKLELNPAS